MSDGRSASDERKPARTALRRLTPRALPPAAAVLRRLASAERDLIRRRLAEASECVIDPSFRRKATETFLLGPLPAANGATGRIPPSSDDSGTGMDLFAMAREHTVKLTAAQERFLFLRYNYARFRVMRIVRAFAGRRLSMAAVREILRWEDLAQRTRGQIMQVNVPLVLAMAKRARITTVDFADLVGEGNFALLRCIDKFDFTRGFKFSTYACRAIITSFARLAAQASRYRGLFPAEYDPAFEKSDFLERKRVRISGDWVAELRSILRSNRADLSDAERFVLQERFALDEPQSQGASPAGKTLDEVGETIGVSKERVRQIQNRAFAKLREALESSPGLE